MKVCEVKACEGCPLRNKYPDSPFVAPKLGSNLRLQIGDNPGKIEAELGHPLGGEGWLKAMYSKAGLKQEENSALNVIQCKPPEELFPTDKEAKKYFTDKEAHDAVEHCKNSHVIPFLQARPWKRIDTFGEAPLRFLLGKSSGVHTWRGSLLSLPGIIESKLAVPTFHPRNIAKDQAMFPVAINDLRKILEIEPEIYNIYPSISDVKAFTSTKFAFDIETNGWTKEINIVGLCAEDYKVIVVPFTGPYIDELKRIFSNATEVVGQNLIQFDLPVLAHNGITIPGPRNCMVWDTMLMHHLRFPVFPHDLEFIGKQFTNKGAWKADKVSYETYCARDVDVTWRSFFPLQSLLQQAGLEDVYRYVSWPMAMICRLMTDTGITRSFNRIQVLREELMEAIKVQEGLLPGHMRTHFVDIRKRELAPEGYINEKGKPAKYKLVPAKKVVVPWRGAAGKKEFLYNYLRDKKGNFLPEQRHIKTREVTTDKNALDKLYTRYKLPELKALKELQRCATLLDNFAKDDLKVNDVLHPSFNVHGTETGRLCIAPDTLVEMPRNLAEFPDGVPLRNIKVGDLVYSLTWDKRLVLRPVKWIGITGIKPTVKITVKSKWDKITSFRVTEDHLVRMFAGDWRPAGSLEVGNRLCGFVRRGIDEYASFFPSSKRRIKGESGGKCKEHRWILAQILGYDRLPSKWDTHHIDENKLNNHPSNLQQIMHSEHMKMHKRSKTPEQITELLNHLENLTYAQRKAVKRSARLMGILPATNHTIVSIEHCDAEEVWDLEVEDTHTLFGGDVALHNSSSGPNIQNQPVAVRYTYVPRRSGGKIVSVDYSGIENRIVAFLAKDHRRATWFQDVSWSEHKYLASCIEGIPYEEVVKSKDKDSPYAMAKVIVHGSDRLMGAKKIAAQYDLDFNRVRDFQAVWKKEIKDTVAWQKRIGEEAARIGWLANPFARKLWLWMSDSVTKAVSFMPQSTAADVIFRAMIALMYMRINWPEEWARKVAPYVEPLPEYASLLAQIHDELLCETETADQVQPLLGVLERVMTQPWPELDGMSLPIGKAFGDSYGDCE